MKPKRARVAPPASRRPRAGRGRARCPAGGATCPGGATHFGSGLAANSARLLGVAAEAADDDRARRRPPRAPPPSGRTPAPRRAASACPGGRRAGRCSRRRVGWERRARAGRRELRRRFGLQRRPRAGRRSPCATWSAAVLADKGHGHARGREAASSSKRDITRVGRTTPLRCTGAHGRSRGDRSDTPQRVRGGAGSEKGDRVAASGKGGSNTRAYASRIAARRRHRGEVGGALVSPLGAERLGERAEDQRAGDQRGHEPESEDERLPGRGRSARQRAHRSASCSIDSAQPAARLAPRQRQPRAHARIGHEHVGAHRATARGRAPD